MENSLTFNFAIPSLYDESAERSVLASMLHNFSFIPLVMERLKEDDFFEPVHQLLFRFLIEYYIEYPNVDYVLVSNALLSKKIENITMEFLEQLIIEYVEDEEILEQIIDIVKKNSIRRKLLNILMRTLKDIQHQDDIISLTTDAVASMLDVISSNAKQSYYKIGDLMEQEYEKIRILANNKTVFENGLLSGFESLDKITTGFYGGNLIIIAARPGIGKSSFMLSISSNMARSGIPIGIFSLEMSKEQLIERLYSMISKIELHNIRTGFLTKTDLEKLSMVKELSKDLNIYIDDSGFLTLNELKIKTKRLIQEKQVRVIFIDYLQLLRGNGKFFSRQEEVADISRNLKALAKELGIPIIALAQLSRQTEHRVDKRPRLSDLRESGQIEQDADLIIFLHRLDYYKNNPSPEQKGLVEVIVAKHRQGATGIVKLKFNSKYTCFEEDNTLNNLQEEIVFQPEIQDEDEYDIEF